MRIQIRERNVEMTEVVRARMHRRLGLAFGRFGERIGRVIVRLSVVGTGKRCEIEVNLHPRSVRVEDTDRDVSAAVDRAADRVSRSITRALERERAWDGGAAGRAGERPAR